MGAGGVHGGHRERMRSKYVRGGLEVLADHEVLELLLYYPIRRRNVNQTAHELLRSEEHTSELQYPTTSRMPSSA